MEKLMKWKLLSKRNNIIKLLEYKQYFINLKMKYYLWKIGKRQLEVIKNHEDS